MKNQKTLIKRLFYGKNSFLNKNNIFSLPFLSNLATLFLEKLKEINYEYIR